MRATEYQTFSQLLTNLQTQTTKTFFGYTTSDVLCLLFDKFSNSEDLFYWVAHFGRMGLSNERNIAPEEVTAGEIANTTKKAIKDLIDIRRSAITQNPNAKRIRNIFNQEKFNLIKNSDCRVDGKCSETIYDAHHAVPALSEKDVQTGQILEHAFSQLKNK